MASGVTSRVALIPRLVVTSGRRFVKRGVLKSLAVNLEIRMGLPYWSQPSCFSFHVCIHV